MKCLFFAAILFTSNLTFAKDITLGHGDQPINLSAVHASHIDLTVAYPGMTNCSLTLGAFGAGKEFAELEKAIVVENIMTNQTEVSEVDSTDQSGSLKVSLKHLEGAYLTRLSLKTISGEKLDRVLKDIFPHSALMISVDSCDP
jgi:hypothetical protein